MRFDGKLEKWNDERGFGFITPLHGGEPVFVHISALPRDGGRPKLGDPLTFEVEAAGNGKKRAVNVQRPGYRPLAVERIHTAQPRERAHSTRLPFRLIVVALALLVAGGFAYTRFTGLSAPVSAPASASGTTRASPSIPAARFQCDGRIHCSQMTSCEEAKFFLRNCPGTKMDGNNDGVPCERQWCTGVFAR